MSDAVAEQVQIYLHRLDHLVKDGLRLRAALGTDATDGAALADLRTWQRECAATVGQLSGGNKAHWLSRAYSQAFLRSLHSDDGTSEVAVEISPAGIVDRVLGVLHRAASSLVSLDTAGISSPPTPAAAPPRFEFVEDTSLREGLARAYVDGRAALAQGRRALGLVSAASILDAIITHALQRRPLLELVTPGLAEGPIGSWSFRDRVAAAERLHLISAGCTRLPDAARDYRDLLGPDGEVRSDAVVSERDARVTFQVLRVILRDLAPSR